jgi:prevent-host-death family protein
MKAVKKISALKARKNLGQLLEEVYYQGAQYVIERAGRPMAAVVPLRQLEEWKDQKATSKRIRREVEAEQTARTKAARGKA